MKPDASYLNNKNIKIRQVGFRNVLKFFYFLSLFPRSHAVFIWILFHQKNVFAHQKRGAVFLSWENKFGLDSRWTWAGVKKREEDFAAVSATTFEEDYCFPCRHESGSYFSLLWTSKSHLAALPLHCWCYNAYFGMKGFQSVLVDERDEWWTRWVTILMQKVCKSFIPMKFIIAFVYVCNFTNCAAGDDKFLITWVHKH